MKKKLIVMLAIVMVLSIMLASSAFADSGSRTGSIGGYSCNGYVNCDAGGGFASTSFGAVGSIYVTLTYRYLFNDSVLISSTTKKDTQGSYVFVSKSKPAGEEYKSSSSTGKFAIYYPTKSDPLYTWTPADLTVYP